MKPMLAPSVAPRAGSTGRTPAAWATAMATGTIMLAEAVLEVASDSTIATPVNSIVSATVVCDGNQAVIWVNDIYYETFQLTPQEIIGTRLGKIATGAWADQGLEKQITETMQSGAPFRGHALMLDLDGVGETRVTVSGSRLRSMANQTKLVLLAVEGDFKTLEVRNGN